eukprot:TRINITY_DN24906_c0_g1_i2.p1 TRINITY_DN24906_c0_g1~~TRINITY_DN24906_c0_g1_i2.p1  ORF type:complete len:106 (+),score=4.88 TRINITY_DN24906_c0_g1_i2:106-423(+)
MGSDSRRRLDEDIGRIARRSEDEERLQPHPPSNREKRPSGGIATTRKDSNTLMLSREMEHLRSLIDQTKDPIIHSSNKPRITVGSFRPPLGKTDRAQSSVNLYQS